MKRFAQWRSIAALGLLSFGALLPQTAAKASGEIKGLDTTGKTVYAVVVSPTGQAWTPGTTSFGAIANASWSGYKVALSEQGTTGIFLADFPTAITSPGRYSVIVYEQAGGAAAVGDTVIGSGDIQWGGSATAPYEQNAVNFAGMTTGSGGAAKFSANALSLAPTGAGGAAVDPFTNAKAGQTYANGTWGQFFGLQLANAVPSDYAQRGTAPSWWIAPPTLPATFPLAANDEFALARLFGMTEANAGTPRFLASALSLGPTGTGGGSLSQTDINNIVAAIFANNVEPNVTYLMLCRALGAYAAGNSDATLHQYKALGNPSVPRITFTPGTGGSRTVTPSLNP